MTAFTTVPTVSPDDAWSAAQNNTYLRDNMSALFPYTAVGDIVVAATSTTLAKISKPAVTSVFSMTSAGTASWVAPNNVTGALHTKGTVDFAPTQTFAGTWADITGATVTLTTTVTCTILIIANVTGYQATAGNSFFVRGVVAGAADGNSKGGSYNGGITGGRNEAISYIYYATGIAAGANIVKLQCEVDSTNNVVTQGRLTAFAYVE